MASTSKSSANPGASSVERRSVPRYSFIAVADIVESASNTHISGRVTDISRNGCYVGLFSPLPTGTSIRLQISTDGGLFTTAAQVIYSQEGMGMGVRFVEVAANQLKVLDAWLAELDSGATRAGIPGFAADIPAERSVSSPPSAATNVTPRHSVSSSTRHVTAQPPVPRKGPWMAVAIVCGIVILGAVFFWRAHSSSTSTSKIVSTPVAARTGPSSEITTTPKVDGNLPIGPGQIATVEELSKTWASKRFLFQNPLTAETVPALVVHLPDGTYWGFYLRDPDGGCEMELVTDLKKLQMNYGFAADHPMLGDPCNRSVFDLARYGPGTNGLVRGEVEQGMASRPPIAIEIHTSGKQVLAVRTE